MIKNILFFKLELFVHHMINFVTFFSYSLFLNVKFYKSVEYFFHLLTSRIYFLYKYINLNSCIVYIVPGVFLFPVCLLHIHVHVRDRSMICVPPN
jgi:hypothetical protein